MKIQLSQQEIEQAVREYVGKGITLANGGEMTVDFTAGRGENGITATIDVPYMGVAKLPVTPVTAPAPAPIVTTQAAAPTTAEAPTVADPVIEREAAPFEGEPATPAATESPAATPGKSLFSSPAA